MTPKQIAFVREYMVDRNATQAAIRAGYSEKTASVVGYENLRKPQIDRAIAEAEAEIAKRNEVDQDQVVEELAGVALSNLSDVVSWGPHHFTMRDSDELPPRAKAAVKSVKVKRRREVTGKGEDAEVWEIEELTFTMHDKVQALVKLGEHLGMWPTKPVEFEGRLDVMVHEVVTQMRGLTFEQLRKLAGSRAPLLLPPAVDDERSASA